jgi:isocitrate dehydrogenase
MKFEAHELLRTVANDPLSKIHAAPVSIAYGDGIGPEIMNATLKILAAAGARIAPEVVNIGEAVYLSGNTSGIGADAWESLRRTKVFLKAPITTPSGGGYKSLNVTIRKTLGLYANVRPCVSYWPYVQTLYPHMDIVIVRENEEDLYAGIEHRQSDEVFQCLKLITRPGCEKIVRYAFEYARNHGRKKVTCMVKDNIMKMTDGLFYKVFEEIGAQYSEIKREKYIVDIGAARMATRPLSFDVIVTPNLYGDILSDIAAEMSGGIGLAGSANIGEHVAMFEAIHGSAPDIAGKGIANPSGLLLSAVMMLVHIGQPLIAAAIHNAWLCTIEEGVHTYDLVGGQTSSQVNTHAFAKAVIARLGKLPQHLRPISYQEKAIDAAVARPIKATPEPAKKVLVGTDIFLHLRASSPSVLASKLQLHQGAEFTLEMITNRGTKVWPNGFSETFCTDHWRCRFMGEGSKTNQSAHQKVVQLLGRLVAAEFDVIKTENLYTFNGENGFALGQGQ